MLKPRAIALFSGGKDSLYSIQEALPSYDIVATVSIVENAGNIQLTDGPEIEKGLLEALAGSFPFVHEEIAVGDPNYLEEVVVGIKSLMNKYDAVVIITGDLVHPEGMDRVLQQKLGVQCVSAASDFVVKSGSEAYLKDLSRKGISVILSGIRNGVIPESFLGKPFDEELINKLKENSVEITGEDGEFQTLVVNAPIMKNKINIESFSLEKVKGRDKKGHVYVRMTNVVYSVVPKE